ncbi:MAG: CAAX amino terminal protease self- immunity [Firmicutes bacterium ADurb.Bin182]|nr:MAG: CAAX amino terminal protease self- immunity [Firmicutes bacterium ADurb.Bin182]
MTDKKIKKVTLQYLLITFVVTGITWGGIYIAQRYGYLMGDSALFYPIYIFGGASSTIASFIVLVKSGMPVKEWLKNVFGLKQNPLSYLIVLLFLLCFIVLGCITKVFVLTMPLWYLVLFTFQNIFEGGLEEAGWRFILQPNLEKVMPFSLATLATCAIWTLWHLPLFFIDGTAQQNMNFGLFSIFFVGYSFSLAIIKRLTGSVWLCVLFHAALNAICSVFAVKFSLTGNIIITAVIVIIALFLNKYKYIQHYHVDAEE